jgi:hypothetical protein
VEENVEREWENWTGSKSIGRSGKRFNWHLSWYYDVIDEHLILSFIADKFFVFYYRTKGYYYQ